MQCKQRKARCLVLCKQYQLHIKYGTNYILKEEGVLIAYSDEVKFKLTNLLSSSFHWSWECLPQHRCSPTVQRSAVRCSAVQWSGEDNDNDIGNGKRVKRRKSEGGRLGGSEGGEQGKTMSGYLIQISLPLYSSLLCSVHFNSIHFCPLYIPSYNPILLTNMEKLEATSMFATDAIMYPPLAATSSTQTIKSNRRWDRRRSLLRDDVWTR